MEFGILGPLEAWDGARELSLGGPKPRALLAALLLRANEVVPADRLIDELWGEDSPEDAAAALRVNVSRLRKALPQDVLTTRSPGYLVRVGPDGLDLHRFERLVDEGRRLLARDLAADASERLRDALSLWRGPALADFAYESFAQAAIVRLEEIRLAAVELRIDADLALGRHDGQVGELEALVAEHPLRERLQIQLMTALYRSGRQAEALNAYQYARRALVDGLGIEPSTALQELERAILRQDPDLDLTRTPTVEGSILVAPRREEMLALLLALAEPLARRPPKELILARLVAGGDDLGPASEALRERRAALLGRGVPVRTAAFVSPTPAEDLVRMTVEQDVDLVLVDGPDELLRDPLLAHLLASAPCDVAVVVGTELRPGPVLVPFVGAEHDWAAVELGAWIAGALGAPMVVAGPRQGPGGRDASRLLANASIAIQRTLGVAAEPLLVEPGPAALLAAAEDVELVIVGLTERWQKEGLGVVRETLARAARPCVVLVRRGLRPGGLAPRESTTRFTWSLKV
jgi:DNA-binding SARP family transcriptional activator